jgi:RNA polymerase sigma factor (sigma-70 family)
MSAMLPVREEGLDPAQYQDNLRILRQRILGFVVRRLPPHLADHGHAEDIAQSCVVALWERYPEKRELAEMVPLAIGVARNKIAQFHRDRERMPGISDEDADRRESAGGRNQHSGERVLEQICAREDMDRLLLGMLKLSGQCRELMRLKLFEEKSYAEIRSDMGVSGNIYEMARRCFRALLRNVGGGW